MVLLHHIVEVFALTQTNPTREDALSFQPFHSRRKGPVLVHIDDPWHRIAGRTQSLTEEALGRRRIPLGGEQELDRLTGRIHCPVQIFVFSFDLYIGLVGAVAFVRRLQMRAAAFVQLRRVGLHPAPDATGVHFHAALRQKFSDVLVGSPPPSVDICHRAPPEGKACTYTSTRPASWVRYA